MKYKRYIKTKNLMLISLVLLGFLSPFVFLTQNVDAKAIKGVQLVAYDGSICMDEDGDGDIDFDGSDDLLMAWDHYYEESITYYKIKSSALLIPYEDSLTGQGLQSMRWCNSVVTNYFGESNTIEIWYGERSTGYSTLTFNLPKAVSDFPVDFEEKTSKTFLTYRILQDIMLRFPLFNKLLNLLR